MEGALRVLFLATHDWYDPGNAGGDEVMWEYARYMSSLGHQVTFVAAGYRGAPRRETVDGLEVVRLGRIHTLWLRTFLYYVRRGRGRFDVVVTEGLGGSRVPRLAPLYVREPILTEWHQVYRPLFAAQYPRLMQGPLNALERFTCRVHRRTLVRAGTEEVRRDFIGLGFRPEGIFVVPVTVRDEWLADAQPPRPMSSNFVWLGKIRKYKRPDHAVRALARVVERFPEARLTIAGRHDDLAYERRLVGLVRDLGLGDKVNFRFNISEDEKREMLHDARALVLPSAVEGFGIVVLEANSRGVPVIASSGVPESVVRHETTGLRYEYGDVDALAGHMCRLLADDEIHRKLSENARSFAQDFGWQKIGARYAAVIESVVKRSPVPVAQPQLEAEIPG